MKAAALVLLALLLAAGLFLVLGRGSGARGEPRIEAAPAGDARVPAPSGTLRTPAAPAEDAAPAEARAGETRNALDAPPAAAATAWIVRVLRDGAPAPDVEVGWADAAALAALPRDGKAVALDVTERVQRAGTTARTNASGELTLAPLPPGSMITARDGGLLAFHAVSAQDVPPIVLELRLDLTLLARVADGRGEPRAGIALGLDVTQGDLTTSARASSAGPRAIATFRHVGVGSGVALDPQQALGTVFVLGVFATPIEATYPLRDWPEEPPVLVVDETGSVVVEVVDEAGDPLDDPRASVDLAVHREQAEGAVLWNRGRRVSEPLAGGRVRFATVALGLELDASFDSRPRRPRASTTFRGPERAGQEVTVRLTVSEPGSVLLFRVLGEDGAALANAELDASLTRVVHGGSVSGMDRLSTDAAGGARFSLLEPWGEGQTLTLALRHHDVGTGETLEAELDLSRELPKGTSDLGDVVLRRPPVLVAGRVIDGQGAPIANAWMEVEAQGDVRAGHETPWWPILFDSTKEDGRFSFRASGEFLPSGTSVSRWSSAATTSAELRLVASSPDHVGSEPLPFLRGTRDVEIVLAQGGALEGSLVAPEGVAPTAFQVEAFRPEDPADSMQRARHGHSERVRADGRFALRGLAPGSVSVTLRLTAGREPLLEVADVAIADGETARDPRLQGIELAGRARTLRVRVLLPDGTPAEGGWVRVCHGDDDAGFLIEAGVALVLARSEPLDLEINVPGFRVARLAGVDSDREVTLQAAFRVRLELDPEVALPPEGMQLQVRLSRVPRDGEAPMPESLDLFRGGEATGWWSSSFGGEGNTFRESREVFATIQEEGTYEVSFFVVIGQQGGGMMSTGLSSAEGASPLELAARDAERTFRVAPDRSELDPLLKSE